MAIGGKKHHKSEVASSISSEALLSRLQEEALAAEQESLHMQKTEADVFKRIEKEEDDLTPSTRENISLEELKRSWMSRIDLNCIFISAAKKTNIRAPRLSTSFLYQI